MCKYKCNYCLCSFWVWCIIFAKSNSISGKVIYEELKKKGVLVRFWGKAKIEDFVRITIGTPEQMNVLFDKLEKIIAEQKGD